MTNNETASVFTCGCFILILVINLLIGGVCTDYALWYYVDVDVPWYADAAIGAVGGEITIPAAVVAWILYHCGVEPPLFDKSKPKKEKEKK